MNYWNLFTEKYTGYADWFWKQIIFEAEPWWQNYFWLVVVVSVFFFALEWLKPWRADQPKFRKDFWLDFFYMFFNFFLFSLLIYEASSSVVVEFISSSFEGLTGHSLNVIHLKTYFPFWAYMIVGFVLRDFTQWWVHRLLHAVDFLWEFHKVHHSVEQMGFAAQLRYHWMENIVYRSIEYLPLALLGVDLGEFFVIHIFAFTWGHYNHTNFSPSKRVVGAVTFGLLALLISTEYTSGWMLLAWAGGGMAFGAIVMGPVMKYLFNSPEMHIWHHSYELPEARRKGVNFGLTLAIWDYIFKTNYIPSDGRDIRLGFPGIEKFPTGFLSQNIHGFFKSKK